MLRELARIYSVKNTELAAVAEFAFRCTVNTLKEQSSGLSVGMTVHALKRQAAWLQALRVRLVACDHPIPDDPATHPLPTELNFSTLPDVLTDATGRPVNADVMHISTFWGKFFAELCMSNSAGLPGGVLSFDLTRAENNIKAIEQQLDAIVRSSDVDFPETAAPDATPQPIGSKGVTASSASGFSAGLR